jgi:hypothetical protein
MVLCASLFSQLVALFSKSQFYHLVKEHRAERYSMDGLLCSSSWNNAYRILKFEPVLKARD